MGKILKVTMTKKDGTTLPLHYALYSDNPVVDRWIEMTKQSLQNNMEIKARVTNNEFNNIGYLMEQINEVLVFINQNYDKELPTFTDFNELDSAILNYLHEEFEVYGDRITLLQEENRWSFELHEKFLSLNEFIHMIETAIHSLEHKFPNFSCLYDFLPAGLHEPVTEVDKLFLEDRFEWGGLYCGYNTLGKDYLSIAPENDWEVIYRDEVRPQIRFAPETWMNFGPDMTNTIRESFYKWYTTLSPEVQAKVPIDDMHKLSLGRYKLGRLILDDSIKQIEPDIEKWFVPAGPSVAWALGNDSCKAKWNREIFTQLNGIQKIEIFD
jgi:hypothetical protein